MLVYLSFFLVSAAIWFGRLVVGWLVGRVFVCSR